MKSLLICLIVVSGALAGGRRSQPTCDNENEKYSECGNLCEDSCSNTCDPSVFLGFGKRRPATNPACVPGCYCKDDHIRNDDGECVPNVPGVCETDRCISVTPNSVYMRCTSGAPTACFKRIGIYMAGGVSGRCMCAMGYSMNSQKQCVPTESDGCLAEAGIKYRVGHLPTPTPNCS